jgi:hypothetical protein
MLHTPVQRAKHDPNPEVVIGSLLMARVGQQQLLILEDGIAVQHQN